MILMLLLFSLLPFACSNQSTSASGHSLQPCIIQSESGTGV